MPAALALLALLALPVLSAEEPAASSAVHPRVQRLREYKEKLEAANPGLEVDVPPDDLDSLNDDLYALLQSAAGRPPEKLTVDEALSVLADQGAAFVHDIVKRQAGPLGVPAVKSLTPEERGRLRELRGRWAFLFDQGTLYAIDQLLSEFSKPVRGPDYQVQRFDHVGGYSQAAGIDHSLFAKLADRTKELAIPDTYGNKLTVVDARPAPKGAPKDLLPGFARVFMGAASGSGYVVYSPPAGEQGRTQGRSLILTAGHVVDGEPGEQKTAVVNGKQYPYTVVAKRLANDGSDVALISVPATGLRSAKVRDVPSDHNGSLFFLGQGQNEDKPSLKLTGAAHKNSRGKTLETSGMSTPGNSGGPLLDEEGCIQGVVCSSKVDAASHQDAAAIVRPPSQRAPNYDHASVGAVFSDHKQVTDLLRSAGYGWVIESRPSS